MKVFVGLMFVVISQCAFGATHKFNCPLDIARDDLIARRSVIVNNDAKEVIFDGLVYKYSAGRSHGDGVLFAMPDTPDSRNCTLFLDNQLFAGRRGKLVTKCAGDPLVWKYSCFEYRRD